MTTNTNSIDYKKNSEYGLQLRISINRINNGRFIDLIIFFWIFPRGYGSGSIATGVFSGLARSVGSVDEFRDCVQQVWMGFILMTAL